MIVIFFLVKKNVFKKTGNILFYSRFENLLQLFYRFSSLIYQFYKFYISFLNKKALVQSKNRTYGIRFIIVIY